jgi:hypothetical protein
MNQSNFLCLLFFVILPFCGESYGQDSSPVYSIHLQIKNVNAEGKAFLQIYQGKSLVNIDSLVIAKNQIAFQGNPPLPHDCIVWSTKLNSLFLWLNSN